MELYLVRHGEAANPGVDGLRPLTRHGKAQATDVAAWCRSQGVTVDAILHSGILRARETADAVARGVTSGALPQETRGLRPEDDVESAALWLGEESRDLMLVGHLPFMGLLASRLVHGDLHHEPVPFAPATLAHLRRDDGDERFRVVHVRHA